MHEIFPGTGRLFPRVRDMFVILFVFLVVTIMVATPLFVVGKISGSLDYTMITGEGKTNTFLAVFMLLSYTLPMIITIWWTIRWFRISPRFDFKPKYPEMLPLVLLAWLLLLITESGLSYFLPASDKQFRLMTNLILEHPVLSYIMLAVAAPFLEEMLFRGIILKFLLKKYRPVYAIIISAVAFGIFHLNIWQFVGASLLGLLLGYLYWCTGTLFYSVLVHFLNNSLAFATVMHFKTMNPESMTFHSNGEALLYILLSLAGFAVVIYGMEKYIRPRQRGTIYLASGNQHKLHEMQVMFPSGFQLRSMSELAPDIQLEETGKTLEANSLQKAKQLSQRFGVNVLADDTGLETDALDGAPGVYSARFAGPDANDEQNRLKLLESLKDNPLRTARFRTVLTLNLGNRWFRFDGIAPGKIIDSPQGDAGFGYDPVFMPDGYDRTFAQMSAAEKNRISHRGKAMKKLIDFLKSFSPGKL